MHKYILLVIFEDGERFWSHWNVKSIAENSKESWLEAGAIYAEILEVPNCPESINKTI